MRLVQFARQIHYLQLAASQTPSVNATLGISGQMETHARNAILANTNQAWALASVLIVHRTLRHELEAKPTMHVNVTQGIRGRMEAHAPSAFSTNTKQAWGLVLA